VNTDVAVKLARTKSARRKGLNAQCAAAARARELLVTASERSANRAPAGDTAVTAGAIAAADINCVRRCVNLELCEHGACMSQAGLWIVLGLCCSYDNGE
jgi:hypothetical protein